MNKPLDRPIILLCSERSGSNLITRMFDAHPDVTGPGAAHLLRVMVPLSPRYAGRPAALRADMLRLFEAKLLSWRLDELPAEVPAACLQGLADAAQMAGALYEAERRAAARRFIFIKENQAFLLIDAIDRIAHAPRFLHMVRDPRDMALSWALAPALRGGVMRAARQWRVDQEGFAQVMAAHPCASIRYEDLIASPATVLGDVCAALDLPFHEHMLSPARHSARAVHDAQTATMLSNLGQPILQENAGRFRTGLSAAQCAFVEAECAALMPRFGYQPTQPAADKTALAAEIQDTELWDKPGYAALPAAERQRFAAWSALVAQLRAG
jgi:hypothetical protein